MHTRCPHCQTVFNVNPEQLRSANGMVRCGHCMDTFNGVLGLSEDKAKVFETRQAEQAQEKESVATVEQRGDRALLRTMPKSQWTVAADSAPHGATNGEAFKDTTDEITEKTPQEGHSADTLGLPAGSSLLHSDPGAISNTELTGSSIQPKALLFAKDVETAEANQESITDEVFEPFGSIVPSLPTAERELDIGEPIDIETLRSFEAQVAVSRGPEPLDASEAMNNIEGEFSQDHEAVAELIYPQVLEDDIARLRAVAARGKVRKVFAALIIGLLGILVLQYAWFMPEDMAMRYPQTRHLLDTWCRFSGCTLAEQRDPAQVKVLSRDVRVHPKYEGALLVSAQLVNAANFVQPYPMVQFTLFNVNGQTIATRTFAPQEYIGPSVDIGAGMIPTVPTQIELDVLAPDEAAVSIEFRFL